MTLRLIFLTLALFCGLFSPFVKGQNSLTDARQNVLFSDALELYQKEKYAAAQRKFAQYLQLETEGEKAIQSAYYHAFCALHLRNPDFENRILRFVNAHPGHPKARQAYTDLGFYYFDQGDYEEAVGYLAKNELTFEQSDAEFEHSYKLGYSYFMTEQWEKASPVFDRIKYRSHPYTSLSRYYAGYLGYKDRAYEQALLDLQEASKDYQLKEETTVLIPSIYYAQEEYAKVLDFAKQVQQERGGLPNGLNLIVGDCYFLNRRYSQAGDYLGKYVKNTSSTISREIYYRLGYAYYQADRLEESLNYLGKSALGDDKLAQVSSFYLGQNHLKLSQKEEALIAFEQCRRMDYVPALQEQAAFFFVKASFAAADFYACIEGASFYERQIDEKFQYRKQEVLGFSTQAMLHTGDYQKAIDTFDQMLTKDEGTKRAYQRIAFNRAVQNYGDGKYREAIEMLQKSLLYPLDNSITHQTNFWLGEIYSLGNKYDSALLYYRKVPASFSGYNQLLYGKGHAQYNSQQYPAAIATFEQFLTYGNPTDKEQLVGVLTRLADCNYVTREYDRALNFYNTVLRNQPENADYVLYQKGMTYMAKNQFNEAVAYFEKVVALTGSEYREAAYYQVGNIYYQKNRTAWAVQNFSQIINHFPEGKYILLAYSKRALANSQLNPDQAIYDYKQIIEKAPSSQLATNAIAALIELSNQGLAVPGIDAYMKQYEQQNPDSEIIMRGRYEKAKRPFLDGDYAGAVVSLKAYLQKYPRSTFRDDALYTLGYSFELTDEKANAIPVYQAIEDPNFRIRGAKNLADIYYEFEDWARALDQYREVQQNAPSKTYWRRATLGLMRTYFATGDFEGSGLNAQLMVEDGYPKAQAEARLYLGKVLLERGEYNDALIEFQKVASENQNRFGAEAQYNVGKTLRGASDLESSNVALIDVRKNFEGYPIWIYQAFLLLAENYVDQDNLFQAEATLQSIIDYADDPDIREQARQRLAQLIAKEND